MTKRKPKDESKETLADSSSTGGDGGVLVAPDKSTQHLGVMVHNAVAGRLLELINELFENVAYRPERGGNPAANNKAAEMLLALVGLYPLGLTTDTVAPGGIHLHGDGSVQINKGDGPDRLTQELIDIVRKGNNGDRGKLSS